MLLKKWLSHALHTLAYGCVCGFRVACIALSIGQTPDFKAALENARR